MGICYEEIAMLEQEFERQCKRLGITWLDEEVRNESLNDFIGQYEDGEKDPQVLLNGYGYCVLK